MRLWTYHPAGFEIDRPQLRIDWAIGRYWNLTDRRFNYRDALPDLHKLLSGETQFLWCCTRSPNKFNTENHRPDQIEWELEIATAHVLALIDSPKWEDMVWPADGANWRALLPTLVLPRPVPDDVSTLDVDALVKVPLSAGCVIQKRRVPTDDENRVRRRRSFAEFR